MSFITKALFSAPPASGSSRIKLRNPSTLPILGPKPQSSFHSTPLRTRAPVPTAPASPARPSAHVTTHSAGSSNGSASKAKSRSGHMVWYREIVPAMLPVFLLSTTVFLSLSLLRTHLSHSLSLTESSERIAELEDQLTKLRRDQKKQRERERRERERILPLVVERVLQRVGAISQAEQDVEEEKSGKQEILLV